MGLFGDLLHGVEDGIGSVLHPGGEDSGASDPSSSGGVASDVVSGAAEQVRSSVATEVDRSVARLTENLDSLLPPETADAVHGALDGVQTRALGAVPFLTSGPPGGTPGGTPGPSSPAPTSGPSPSAAPSVDPTHQVAPPVHVQWTGNVPHAQTPVETPTWCTAGRQLDHPDPTTRATNRALYMAHVLYGSQSDPCVTLYCQNAPVGECQHVASPDNPRRRATCESVANQLLAHLPSQTQGEPPGYTREAAVASVCAPPSNSVNNCQPGGTLRDSVCHLHSAFCALDEECRDRLVSSSSSSPGGTVDTAAIARVVADAVDVDHPHHLHDILHTAAAIARKTVGCTVEHIPHALGTGGLPVLGTDAIACFNGAMEEGGESLPA